MKAIAGTARQVLLDEYRIALRMWSETKILYPQESAEFAEATSNLDQLEQDLVISKLQELQQPRLHPSRLEESV